MNPCKLLRLLLTLTASLFLAGPGLAQSTVVTYQGFVTANGTNFSGHGQFKAALVTETNLNHTATATANPPSGGFITVINVTFGGNGYVAAPAVTISGGGGAGATATAGLSGGEVTSITINNPGSAYSSTPTVTIAPPPANLNFTTYWSNDGTSSAGSEPTSAVNAPVSEGLFTLKLGDSTLANMTALPGGLFQQDNLRVRLWFNDGVSGLAVLSPTQPLTATPYASYASAARGVTTESNQPVQLTINGSPVLRITAANDPVAGHTVNLVGGSAANIISNGYVGGFIGGGGSSIYPNRVGGNYASVIGGVLNTASGLVSTAMGNGATASGDYSTAMGFYTSASANYSTAMGNTTIASGSGSTAMGLYTTASGGYSTTMGRNTTASGYSSTAMGYYTSASGESSTAIGHHSKATHYAIGAGYFAQANHSGSFVWADSTSDTPFASSAANQFLIRASNGVGINTTNPGAMLQLGDVNRPNSQGMIRLASRAGVGEASRYWDIGVPEDDFAINGKFFSFVIDDPLLGLIPEVVVRWDTGNVGIGTTNPVSKLHVIGDATFSSGNAGPNQNVSWVPGNASWSFTSDRNSKDRVAPVDTQFVLEKVARLPINEWSYIGYDQRHIGPMAQDFHAQFPLNPDDKSLNDADLHGVALAAIQGLNQKVEDRGQRAEVRSQRAEVRIQRSEVNIQELRAENAELKQRLEKLERILNEKNGGAQ